MLRVSRRVYNWLKEFVLTGILFRRDAGADILGHKLSEDIKMVIDLVESTSETDNHPRECHATCYAGQIWHKPIQPGGPV